MSSPADTPPATPDEESSEDLLEMRQVAGLTSGSVMVLHQGSFQFRESEKDIGFSLVVEDEETVTVIGGSASALIDEIPLTEPTPLGQAVLNVGSACFTVRSPRPQPSNAYRLERLEAARRPPSPITVPRFENSARDQPVQTRSSRFGSLLSRSEHEEDDGFDSQTWEFLEQIRDVRSVVANRHRWLHPDPEELNSRLSRLDPGLWDRTAGSPMFGRIPIAFSTIPWEPRFDEPERIPEKLYQPIQEMSCLPWVPVTANLAQGPVGIVGGRSAALSCARSAVLYLASVTSPTDIEFSIVTAQGQIEDWEWSSSLPNLLFPGERDRYCIAVADGMTHFEGAGFSHEAVRQNEMGLIVVAESRDDLPDYCGTILELFPDGQCRVTNHLDEQIAGTPIGVTSRFAASLATKIREAVGDGSDSVTASPAQADGGSTPGAPADTSRLPHVAPGGRWGGVPPIDDLINLDENDEEWAAKQANVQNYLNDENYLNEENYLNDGDDPDRDLLEDPGAEDINFEAEYPEVPSATLAPDLDDDGPRDARRAGDGPADPDGEPTIEMAAISPPPLPTAPSSSPWPSSPPTPPLAHRVEPLGDEEDEEEDLDALAEEVARVVANHQQDPDNSI